MDRLSSKASLFNYESTGLLMIEYFQLAYNSGKAAFDVAKGITALNSEVERNLAVVEIQRLVLDGNANLMAAQQSHSEALNRVDDLEKEILRLKDWSAEKQNYQLKSIDPSGFAYMPKPGMNDGQPPHWLCTNCFEQAQKSILQLKGTVGQFSTHHCNRCSGQMAVYARRSPSDDD